MRFAMILFLCCLPCCFGQQLQESSNGEDEKHRSDFGQGAVFGTSDIPGRGPDVPDELQGRGLGGVHNDRSHSPHGTDFNFSPDNFVDLNFITADGRPVESPEVWLSSSPAVLRPRPTEVPNTGLGKMQLSRVFVDATQLKANMGSQRTPAQIADIHHVDVRLISQNSYIVAWHTSGYAVASIGQEDQQIQLKPWASYKGSVQLNGEIIDGGYVEARWESFPHYPPLLKRHDTEELPPMTTMIVHAKVENGRFQFDQLPAGRIKFSWFPKKVRPSIISSSTPFIWWETVTAENPQQRKAGLPRRTSREAANEGESLVSSDHLLSDDPFSNDRQPDISANRDVKIIAKKFTGVEITGKVEQTELLYRKRIQVIRERDRVQVKQKKLVLCFLEQPNVGSPLPVDSVSNRFIVPSRPAIAALPSRIDKLIEDAFVWGRPGGERENRPVGVKTVVDNEGNFSTFLSTSEDNRGYRVDMSLLPEPRFVNESMPQPSGVPVVLELSKDDIVKPDFRLIINPDDVLSNMSTSPRMADSLRSLPYNTPNEFQPAGSSNFQAAPLPLRTDSRDPSRSSFNEKSNDPFADRYPAPTLSQLDEDTFGQLERPHETLLPSNGALFQDQNIPENPSVSMNKVVPKAREKYPNATFTARFDQQIAQIVTRLLSSTDRRLRENLRPELKALLEKRFDTEQQTREQLVEQLQQRLEAAKASVTQRRQERQTIVNQQLSRIMGLPEDSFPEEKVAVPDAGFVHKQIYGNKIQPSARNLPVSELPVRAVPEKTDESSFPSVPPKVDKSTNDSMNKPLNEKPKKDETK